MKLKSVTFVLGITTLLFGITAGVLYTLINPYEETICDREWTITSYKKVIDAMGRSNIMSLDQPKTELTIDFNLGESGYNDHNNEHYYVLHPKDRMVDPQEIWSFTGLELVFDQHKN